MNTEEFVEKYAVSRKNTDSLKWDALEERFGDADLLPLWVADMEFKVPDSVTQALTERINHGVYGYSNVPESYYAAFFNWQWEHHQKRKKKEWLRFSRGVVESLLHLIQIYTEVDDSVLIQPPVYYPFANVVNLSRRNLVRSPLKKVAGRYVMDLADFENKIISENVKLYILCSPHNPVGRVWEEKELADVLAICKKHHVRVIADEIHQDFILTDRPFMSVLNVNDGEFSQDVIVVNAASKTFNLASLLNGHIIIPNEKWRGTFDRKISSLSLSENSLLGLIAGCAAYEGGSEWFAALLKTIKGNFNYIKDTLAEQAPQIGVADLEGTYLLWLDLSCVAQNSELENFIKEECHLALDFGSWFAEDTGGFVRMNLATTPENIKKAVASLVAGVNQKGK